MITIKPSYVLDKWQEEYLPITTGHTILYCGRQVGKSDLEAYVEANYLLNTPNAHLLIVGGVERQAEELYTKILVLIETFYPKLLKQGKDRPFKTIFKLKNGAVCRTEPLGVAGSGARRHAITRLVIEEMQQVEEAAFAAITPMMLTTGGDIKMLGTARKKEGYVYERLKDPDFTVFRVDAEEVAEKRPEPMRTIMIQWLAKEKKRLGNAFYAQEYLAIPQDNLFSLFDINLLRERSTAERRDYYSYGKFYGGSDIAALGEDISTFEIFDGKDKDNIFQVQHFSTSKTYPHQTAEKIIELNKTWHFKSYGIDSGGLGVGVLGILLKEHLTNIVALDNSRINLDNEDKSKTKLMKESMYLNLLTLLQSKKVTLLNDPEILESLKTCQYEKDGDKLRIWGSNTHIAEGIIRGLWVATQDKTLSLWAR